MGLLHNLFRHQAYSFRDFGFKYDIHSHILPGVDDGSGDVAVSLAMLEKMRLAGVEKVTLTPHVASGLYPDRPDLLRLEFERLRENLTPPIKSSMQLRLAAEYMIDEDFENVRDLLCYKDGSVLVEMSYSNRSVNLLETIFRLVSDGYRPILAHPERYSFYFGRKGPGDGGELEKLIDMGCRFQLNVMSLTGAYGPGSIGIVNYLLDHDWYTFIGTDLHSPSQMDLFKDFCISPERFEKVKQLCINNKQLF